MISATTEIETLRSLCLLKGSNSFGDRVGLHEYLTRTGSSWQSGFDRKMTCIVFAVRLVQPVTRLAHSLPFSITPREGLIPAVSFPILSGKNRLSPLLSSHIPSSILDRICDKLTEKPEDHEHREIRKD